MKEDILTIPDLLYFDKSWDNLQKYLKSKGSPPWKYMGDLDLYETELNTLGNLVSVGGFLNLYGTQIESLGNLVSVGGWLSLDKSTIESLGNLETVGYFLDLDETKIRSFGKLKSVGGHLNLRGTPLSEKYSAEEISEMINVSKHINM